MSEAYYDVAIAGAGPAGLALAALLARKGIQVGLFERNARTSLSNPAYDGREIALTHRAWRILADIGAHSHIDQKQVGFLRHAKVLNGASPYALSFVPEKMQHDTLGFILSNHLIRSALYETVNETPCISLHTDFDIQKVSEDKKSVTLSNAQGRSYRASMLVVADGRFSKIRDMLGIAVDRRDYGRVCMVMRLSHDKSLHETAYEIFGDERTMALLPLASKNNKHESSLVLTLSPARAQALMAIPSESFLHALNDKDLQTYCGQAQLASERYAYPLVGIYAHSFSGDRWALIGDAAIGMHPVTAHGFNLGLRAAEILSQQITSPPAEGRPLEWSKPLSRFHRELRRVSWPIYHGTNALVGLYTDSRPLAHIARTALLRTGSILKPARHLLIRSLMDGGSQVENFSVKNTL